MSEHYSIEGPVIHYHMPWQHFTYCRKCKKECENLKLKFDECHLCVICTTCGYVIWVSNLEPEFVELDKKCHVCGKPTSYWDSSSLMLFSHEKETRYYCCSKCRDADFEKIYGVPQAGAEIE